MPQQPGLKQPHGRRRQRREEQKDRACGPQRECEGTPPPAFNGSADGRMPSALGLRSETACALRSSDCSPHPGVKVYVGAVSLRPPQRRGCTLRSYDCSPGPPVKVYVGAAPSLLCSAGWRQLVCAEDRELASPALRWALLFPGPLRQRRSRDSWSLLCPGHRLPALKLASYCPSAAVA